MPPKAPNLKFKPKLVSQPKQPAPGAPSSEFENLSSVQLDRLRRQQEDAPATATAAAATESTARLAAGERASELRELSSNQHRGTASAAGGTASTEKAAGGSHPHSHHQHGTSQASPTARKSAAAQLHEAAGRYFDMDMYNERANPLPVNTINDILGGGEEGGDGEEEEGRENQPRIYRPTPIASATPGQAPARPMSVTATTATKAAEADGVAFLQGAIAESQASCAANKRFYESTLAEPTNVSASSSSSPSSSLQQQGHLAWMQLPRFHGPNPPFVLQDLPPGKVGELKVLRSGRVVLEIAGVYYDVWVDEDGGGGCGSAGANSQEGHGGCCSTVAVTQPSSYPMDPHSRARCYEVGMLEKKMICIPTVEERR